MILRKILSLAVPVSVAVGAFLHAHAIGSLVDATMAPSSIAPFAQARAAAAPRGEVSSGQRSADSILGRNAFDHVAGPLPLRAGAGDVASPGLDQSDPTSAPPCDGVRAVATVRGADAGASFVALRDGTGKSQLTKRGLDVGALNVVYVAEDRVWLQRDGVLCQARVFDPVTATPALREGAVAMQTPFEKEIAAKIVRTGPTEFQIDRGALNRLLEAQTELMKAPLVPEKDGDRVVGFRLLRVKPGSVIASLGLSPGDRLVSINGVELTSTEGMLEVYARLRSGALDRLSIHVLRNGKPTNLDYVIR